MNKPGDLRVWYTGKVPADEFEYFEVKSVDEAIKKLKELIARDLADDSITDNAMGLEEYYNDDEFEEEWLEFYDEAGRDIHEIMDNE